MCVCVCIIYIHTYYITKTVLEEHARQKKELL